MVLRTLPVLFVFLGHIGPQAQSPGERHQLLANQTVEVEFLANVSEIRAVRNLPPPEKLKGYLIDEDAKWEIKLEVLPHDNKAPFAPGLRTCFVNSLERVFGTADIPKITGKYRFTFTWNIRVPGKKDFERFHAVSVQ